MRRREKSDTEGGSMEGRRLPFCQVQERLLNVAPPPPPHPSNSPLHPSSSPLHPSTSLPHDGPHPPSFITTLNIVFSVTYNLESRNAKTICLCFSAFANKGQIGCLGSLE